MASDQQVLFLVRHGEAASKQDNPERPLTEPGRRAVEKIAAWAARAGLTVDEIRHSGKLRAEQTAQVFGEHLGPSEPVVAMADLGPNDDVGPVSEELAAQSSTLMLVGHLPFLGRLVGRLVVGDPDSTLVEFDTAGLVALRHQDGRWTITCVLHPGLVD